MVSSKEVKTRSVEDQVAWYGKVARRKDLLAKGCTAWSLKTAEEAGLIRRIARGYYALPDADPLDVRLALHQARRTCFTKAEQLGLWVIKRPPLLHVAAAHGRPIHGCVVHKVSGEQTLLDILRQCVKCGSEVEGLAALESAVVLKKCSIAELRAEFAGREDTRGRAIIDMIDPQAMSIAETVARYYLRKAGLNVQGQFYVKGVCHIDLLVEGVLGVETDGETYHNTEQGWAEDLRRDNLLVIKGVWCLRIPAKMVLGRPDIMLSWVRQALAVINSAPQ
ncbi:type IV toxin-antitoxin system AbiEi family antitoxin domain-containing protein [Arthrobacter alpinus]|uniref:type IV toxin-antitoxin system AbiEi family antitoxin domain-containing protein n=1 Tax=Arthrobacter alpinus TaxID=656366 RepID=UPI001647D88C|nr:type IV toxin-antitoxin system AbiEi family antitoxin domain-containing protein [Arthrobacter alpinus]